MKLLLDTHVLLWWLDDPNLLTAAARDAIADPNNEVFISSVVTWEIAIKRGLGKLTAPNDLADAVVQCSFRELPVSIARSPSSPFPSTTTIRSIACSLLKRSTSRRASFHVIR